MKFENSSMCFLLNTPRFVMDLTAKILKLNNYTVKLLFNFIIKKMLFYQLNFLQGMGLKILAKYNVI